MKKRKRITRGIPNSGKTKVGSSNDKISKLLYELYTPKITASCM